MSKLKIAKMNNAYGINSISINLTDGKDLYQELIYSRNGTFKTSFTKTLNDVNNDEVDNIEDRLTGKRGEIELSLITEGKEEKELYGKFIIFSKDIYENSPKNLENYEHEIETLALNKEQSEIVKKIMSDTFSLFIENVNKLLKGSGYDFDILLNKFTDNSKSYVARVEDLLKKILSFKEQDISQINVTKLKQKVYDIIDDETFNKNVNNYLTVIKNKINCEIFDIGFNEGNYSSFLSAVDKTSFLNEKLLRGIVIGDKKIYKYEELKKLFKEEMEKISKDPEVVESGKKLEKSMGTSQESTLLKEGIKNNPALIKQLSLGKDNIIISHLKQNISNLSTKIEEVNDCKLKLEKIKKESSKEKSKFESAIELYKRRFRPVFTIEIDNKTNSLLGLELPYIKFKHERSDDNINEELLYKILSSGEKTTLNILKFIVELESKKNEKSVIVLDDIVETFDYSNRYAFIEYINDLVNDDFPIIILTHNFEFYNNLRKRIPKLRTSIATKNKNGKVEIFTNKNINKDMEQILKCENKRQFICAVPYLRELLIMLRKDVKLLNSCLHFKEKTPEIKLSDIYDLFENKEDIKLKSEEMSLSYLESLFELCNMALKKADNYDISWKTILALGCRIKIEEKIIGSNFDIIKEIEENQTRILLENNMGKLYDEVIECVEKVLLATPEFIHINSFMYEPLIDIDIIYLKDLYNQISDLDCNKIWK